jgi:hypothetical protein
MGRRVGVMDRGMASRENVPFLREQQRRYIIVTPNAILKQFEKERPLPDWTRVRDRLEVQWCPAADGGETMHDRFTKRVEEGLAKIAAMATGCPQTVEQLLRRHTRAEGLLDARGASQRSLALTIKLRPRNHTLT